jgi:hypothetical protein
MSSRRDRSSCTAACASGHCRRRCVHLCLRRTLRSAGRSCMRRVLARGTLLRGCCFDRPVFACARRRPRSFSFGALSVLALSPASSPRRPGSSRFLGW